MTVEHILRENVLPLTSANEIMLTLKRFGDVIELLIQFTVTFKYLLDICQGSVFSLSCLCFLNKIKLEGNE